MGIHISPPQTPSTMSTPTIHNGQLRRVVLTSFVGTTIEWYDYFIYGTAAALIFNKLFFPTFDPLAGTMAAFATYSVGFFARPVGGVVFGHFGDRIGRKSMLVLTLMIMGFATFFIGLLPTYETIGVAAPICLTLLRFLQGFGVGGEWGGAVLMAVEHGDGSRRGFYGSWAQAGVPAGLLLATSVFALCTRMPEEMLFAWGWRIPFLLGILLTGIGLFIRLNVGESPLFEKLRASKSVAKMESPLKQLWRSNRREVLVAMGARFGENISFYILTVFMITYAVEVLKSRDGTVLNAILLASALALFTIPGFAMLSDRIGRRPVYLGGALFMMAISFPTFWLVGTGRPEFIVVAIVAGLSIGHAAMYGPQAAMLSELFGTGVRYSGASLGFQLVSPLAGGLAPLIATSLLTWSGNQVWPVACYLILASLVTFIAVWFAPETYRFDLNAATPDNARADVSRPTQNLIGQLAAARID
jgi:MFS transporter, MHS family, shikimate and dehydroshikimate transport protein